MHDASPGRDGGQGSPAEIGALDWSKFGITTGTVRIRQVSEGARNRFDYLPAPRVPTTQEAHAGRRLSEPSRILESPREPGGASAGAYRLSGPIQFTLGLLESWQLRRHDAVRLLGFDDSDAAYVDCVLAGRDQFRGRDARDRIAHLFRIRSTLSALFRDLEVENDWLREAHTLLDGRSPMELLLGGSMEDLLLVSEYADAAAGR